MFVFKTRYLVAFATALLFGVQVQASGLYVPDTQGTHQSSTNLSDMEEGKGEQSLSLNFGYANAGALWTRSGEVQYANGEAETNTYGIQMDYQTSLNEKLSLAASLGLKSAEIIGGGAGNRTDGESTSQVSGYGLQLNYLTYQSSKIGSSYNLSSLIGLRLPGDGSPYDFIALHDGTNKLDVGIQQSLSLQDISIINSVKYTFREGVPADQLEVVLTVPIRFTSRFTAGPTFVYFDTLGGIDLDLSPGSLFRQRNAINGGPSFPELNEDFFAAGALVSFAFTETFDLKGTYLQKAQGRNTDQSSQFSLGMGYIF